MDDLQLNISVPVKVKKKKLSISQDNSSEYKFISKPNFTGKTIARKRKKNFNQVIEQQASTKDEPRKKFPKLDQDLSKPNDLDNNLRDLSQNKGKFKGKDYQKLSDVIQIKQKPRPGGWISSLFKNNPDVPRLGQRAIKPLVEKVFAGKTFLELDLHPHCVANLQQNLNLKELMTVQQNAIPVILQGRDVLIRSQTGSGKTLAYALPIVEGLQAIRPKINRHDGIRALIVVPTRELAVQTYELLVKLVKPFTWLVPGLLSGGQKRKAEKARLRKGLNILVGTPGRINDHLRHTKSLNFCKTGCLVLDEADRLLDMGYEKDVAAIVKAIEDHKKAATYDPMALMKSTIKKDKPDEDNTEATNDTEQDVIKHHLTKVFLSNEHQTILLSATLTKAVENLAGITMADPVFVDTLEGRTVVVADSLKTSCTELKQVNKSDDKINATVPLDVLLDDSKSKKEFTEHNTETRKGLKAFSGISRLDFFQNDDNTSKVKTLPIKPETIDEESDSDSDYEYFKVQKELEAKEEVLQKDVELSEIDNTFQNAVKSAIVEDELVLPATVNQSFLIVPMKLRLVTLCALIIKHCVLNKKGGKMIVFMATLEMVDYHSDLIETVLSGSNKKERKTNKNNNEKSKNKEKSSDSEFEIDYEVPSDGGLVPVDIDMYKLHGSMPHEQRMEIFKQFRAAKRGVLLCTDVAARGIDVPRVDLVLQYCAPASATDYVHRVGRTGRAAHVGAAVLFLLPSEAEFVRHLEQKRIRLRQEDERVALEALSGATGGGAGGAGRAAAALQARLELAAHADTDWLARASRAYTSWVRFYAGYPREVRQWLDAKQLHLGHAAKSFALRDPPGTLARRARSLPDRPDRPDNRLTVDQQKLPGFPKSKVGSVSTRVTNKQSSMHTASEFDSGLEPLHHAKKKKKKK